MRIIPPIKISKFFVHVFWQARINVTHLCADLSTLWAWTSVRAQKWDLLKGVKNMMSLTLGWHDWQEMKDVHISVWSIVFLLSHSPLCYIPCALWHFEPWHCACSFERQTKQPVRQFKKRFIDFPNLFELIAAQR